MNANFCHSIIGEFRPGEDKKWENNVISDMLSNVTMGLDNCEEENCEICEEM